MTKACGSFMLLGLKQKFFFFFFFFFFSGGLGVTGLGCWGVCFFLVFFCDGTCVEGYTFQEHHWKVDKEQLVDFWAGGSWSFSIFAYNKALKRPNKRKSTGEKWRKAIEKPSS